MKRKLMNLVVEFIVILIRYAFGTELIPESHMPATIYDYDVA